MSRQMAPPIDFRYGANAVSRLRDRMNGERHLIIRLMVNLEWFYPLILRGKSSPFKGENLVFDSGVIKCHYIGRSHSDRVHRSPKPTVNSPRRFESYSPCQHHSFPMLSCSVRYTLINLTHWFDKTYNLSDRLARHSMSLN